VKRFFILCLLFIGINTFAQTPSLTSIISHKVEANQTLYAIGRLYHVSPQVLMKNNPQYGPDFHLKTGSIVKVPTVEVKGSDVNAVAPVQVAPKPNNNIQAQQQLPHHQHLLHQQNNSVIKKNTLSFLLTLCAMAKLLNLLQMKNKFLRPI
jgi:LysM repeat protein